MGIQSKSVSRVFRLSGWDLQAISEAPTAVNLRGPEDKVGTSQGCFVTANGEVSIAFN